jgi:hypothetical protein
MMVGRAFLAVSAALAALGLAACGGGGDHRAPAPAPLRWTSTTVSVPRGRQAIVQSAVWCGGRWYVAGATADARGNTRPAVWTSADAATWRRVRLRPGDDYYAARAVMTSIACSRGRVAALGAKPGGAHGNPRVETWRQLDDGSLAAVPAPFVQYGGQDAVSVNHLSGGGPGYLVTGTRVSGAAVWSSRDGSRFTLHEQAPGLASTPAVVTQALDALWWQGSWTVVGESTRGNGRLVATAWTGRGAGPWVATQLPGGTSVTTGERVALTSTGPVLAGIDDRAFGVWSEREGTWSLSSTFGVARAEATSPMFVSALVWTGSELAVTYTDGRAFHLALGSPTSLTTLRLPTRVTDRGDHTAAVASHGSELLLLTDVGTHAPAHVWLTHLSH